MDKKGAVIEFFKYQLLNNANTNKSALNYVTMAKISIKIADQNILLSTVGQISALEQATLLNSLSIFQAIHQLDSEAIEEVKGQSYKYRFKVPVHFKWASDFCPQSCEEIFNKTLSLSSQLIHVTNFVDLNKQTFSLSAYFEDEVTFETKYKNTEFFLDLRVHGVFSKKVSVKNFKGKIDFSNSHFKERLEMADFQCSSIVFSESIFDNQVEIRRVVFEKDANFYNTKFKLAPILSEVVFKESANFINTKMDFTFYELREQVEEIVKEQYPFDTIPFYGSGDIKKDKAKSIYREKISSDFQDTFRLIKNILIKDGNALEASKYHKMELYAQEIGLIGVEDRGIKANVPGDYKRNMDRIGKIVDRWQLAFYRHLSDHHTNLLQVFNNFITTACLYFCFLAFFSKDNLFSKVNSDLIVKSVSFLTSWWTSSGKYLLHEIAIFIYHILILLLLLLALNISIKSFLLFCKKIKRLSTLNLKQVIFLLWSKTKELWNNAVDCLRSISFFLCGKTQLTIDVIKQKMIFLLQRRKTKKLLFILFILFFLIPYFALQGFFEKIGVNAKIPIQIAQAGFFIFCIIALPIIISSTLIRAILMLLIYPLFFFIVLPTFVGHSSSLIEFLSKAFSFSQEDKLLAFVGLLHFLLQSAILWSLQKTARKNSIVPS